MPTCGSHDLQMQMPHTQTVVYESINELRCCLLGVIVVQEVVRGFVLSRGKLNNPVVDFLLLARPQVHAGP